MGIPSFSGCTSGSYCSDQQATKVGDKQTQIYHRTVTTLTGQGPAYSGSKTETYIIKPNAAGIDTWTLAATTTDGGKTQTFTDAAGADFKKSMAPGGNLNKNVQAQVQKTLTAGGAKQGLVTLPGTSGSLEKITSEQQKALGIVSPNVGNSPTGDATSAPVNLQDKIGSSGQSRTGAGSFGTHRYPLNLNSSSQDKIKFDMLEYSPRGFQQDNKTNLAQFAERKSTGRKSLGTVFLPITSGISEANSCGWGEDRMDPGQALLANVALTSIQKGLSEGFGVAANAVETAAGAGNQDMKNAIATGFAAAASGAGGILSRTQGAVINPNLELLFNGPALRPFSFTFKMSARSELEAKEIIKIIRFFKQGMSPQKSSSNLFIKAPHTFKISYIRGKKDSHPFIGEIKECALQSFNVNYTPEGQYATFHDGPMISYEIQMQFTELEPVFNEDYGNSGSLPANLLFKTPEK